MHLITIIPQVDGGIRELYAATAREAREKRGMILDDHAMVEFCEPAEWVDVAPDGTRTRYKPSYPKL